jgi:excinuclease ABC subunit C
LKIIRRIFPYGTCTPNSGKACFDYQIGLCPGSCIGAISVKDYQKNIKKITLLLEGKKSLLLKKLAKENPDQAVALKHIQDVSLLVGEAELGREKNLTRIEAYDISHFAGQESYGAMTVVIDGELDNREYRLFKIKSSPKNDDLRALAEVLSRRLEHEEWGRPDLILLDGGKPQVDFIDKLFKAKNINIPLLGISKFGGDELVYPPGLKKNLKELAEGIKPILLKAREEAHRFGNRARKHAMSKRV